MALDPRKIFVKKTYMVLGDYDEKYPIEIDLDHNDFGIKHVQPRPKPEPIDEKTLEEIRAKRCEEGKKLEKRVGANILISLTQKTSEKRQKHTKRWARNAPRTKIS